MFTQKSIHNIHGSFISNSRRLETTPMSQFRGLGMRHMRCGVRSLGPEDPLGEGMATQPSILVWSIPTDRGAWRATVHGAAKSRTRLSDLAAAAVNLTQCIQSREQHAGDFAGGPVVKKSPCNAGGWVQSLVRELRSHLPQSN